MPRKMGRVNDAHEGTRMPTTGIFLFKAALPLRWLESVMCCPRIGEKIMPRERLAASPVFLANTGHDDRPISTRLAEVLEDLFSLGQAGVTCLDTGQAARGVPKMQGLVAKLQGKRVSSSERTILRWKAVYTNNKDNP